MRIAWLGTDCNTPYRIKHNSYGGVTYYRLLSPMKILPYDSTLYLDDFRNEIDEKNLPESYLNFVKKFDLIITKHMDNPTVFVLLRGACDKAGVPLVMDFDDNIYAVRNDQPAFKEGYNDGGEKRAFISAAASLCDALFVTNENLKFVMKSELKKRFNVDMPIYVLPNFNSVEDWKGRARKHKDKLTIGWAGSLTHDSDLKMIIPALEDVLMKYPNVEVELMGGIKQQDIVKFFKTVKIEVLNRFIVSIGTPHFKSYPFALMRKSWDIGIAPLIKDEFNLCKSDIKWLEYSMKKIPTVASKDTVYERIEHGKTGFLADTTEEWIDMLSDLIENEDKRKKIGENAYNHIVKKLQYKQHANLWKNAIKDVLKTHKEK